MARTALRLASIVKIEREGVSVVGAVMGLTPEQHCTQREERRDDPYDHGAFLSEMVGGGCFIMR
jgi:hypothetical protein